MSVYMSSCLIFITVRLSLCFSLKMHEQRKSKQKDDEKTPEGAVPAYLLDREGQSRAKVLSNMIKQKRKEKAVSVHSNVCTKRAHCSVIKDPPPKKHELKCQIMLCVVLREMSTIPSLNDVMKPIHCVFVFIG